MKLALGTVQFGLRYGVANQIGQVAASEVRSILNLALSKGINTLDTAVAYGESEERLGLIGVSDWEVISKLPAIPDDCKRPAAWIHEVVIGSLRRLNINSLYGLLLHSPSQLLGGNGVEIYRTLTELKAAGLIEKIGVSIYDPLELNELFQLFEFDLVQAPLNIFDRRLVESGWLTRLTKMGIDLHVRSVFLQGLLLMPPQDRPSKFNKWSALWVAWDKWIGDSGLTPQEACLRYIFGFAEIKKIIIGVDSADQLEAILGVTVTPLNQIPDYFSNNDISLLNPANWFALK